MRSASMRPEAALAHEPLLLLPGFKPGALGFATRTTIALLLAYFTAFLLQLDTASSAGLCVAIVAQPTPGMAMSKAIYRAAGTLIGGVAAVAIVGIFAQDRTMLLAAFILWLGACTFVASLLRDFRSYGAVLCGYTVGIIAVASIDSPDSVFYAAVNRVAAILIGIVSVAVVNSLLAPRGAYDNLVAALRGHLDDVERLADDTLRNAKVQTDRLCVHKGSTILALQTEASYAATELPDGIARSAGARSAIAALLGMISATRAIGAALLRDDFPQESRVLMQDVADELRSGGDDELRAHLLQTPSSPLQAFLQERMSDLLAQHDLALDGLASLTSGARPKRRVRLTAHHDVVGAGLSALRAIIAVAMGAVFCIYAGWAGASLLLVQQAAFIGLLGMQPNPTAAGINIAKAMPLPALACGFIIFVLLPQVSGFVPFALAVGPFMFLFVLAGQHPRWAPIGPGLVLYFTLLLSPSNEQSFDLSSFLNTVLVQVVALLFMVVSFWLILPVSPRRRLARVSAAIAEDLRKTLSQGRSLNIAETLCVQYDRLAQVELWLGPPTPARLALLHRLYSFAQLDTALRRAFSGLEAVNPQTPEMRRHIDAARNALLYATPAKMAAASRNLLGDEEATGNEALLRAASGLFGADVLLRQHARALVHYGILDNAEAG